MGNTIIIELNHDRIGEIEADPIEFVNTVLEKLRAGWPHGRIPGGMVVACFPRMGQAIEKAWEEWLRYWEGGGFGFEEAEK